MQQLASIGVGYAAAFGGGMLSFVSPCVLPIVPVVLSVVTGTDITSAAETRSHLAKVARNTALFVLGFAVMFVLIGLSATALGQSLVHDKTSLTRISGVVMLVMAGMLAGGAFLGVDWLGREARFRPDLSRLGPFAAPVAGAAFGVAWTPCVTPILASVLAVAAAGGSVPRAAVLLGLYSAGLGLPCLAVSLGFSRLATAFALLRRQARALTVLGAAGLAGFGVLLVFDRLTWLTTHLQSL
ncbi:MAG: cytochrome c biogenesis CcdA family protein [Acidimicrobiales bacterium]